MREAYRALTGRVLYVSIIVILAIAIGIVFGASRTLPMLFSRAHAAELPASFDPDGILRKAALDAAGLLELPGRFALGTYREETVAKLQEQIMSLQSQLGDTERDLRKLRIANDSFAIEEGGLRSRAEWFRAALARGDWFQMMRENLRAGDKDTVYLLALVLTTVFIAGYLCADGVRRLMFIRIRFHHPA